MRKLVLLVGVVALTASAAACASSSASGSSRTTKSTSVATGEDFSPVPAAAAPVPAAASAGCGHTVVRPGQTTETVRVAGTKRWYLQHVPPAHDGRTPVPVVLDLHGYSEGAWVHSSLSGLGEFGDAKGFVTVTPQGQGMNAVVRWDTAPGSKDLVFVAHLLDAVERSLCVDRNRIYVTGLSNGAFMTSAIACALSKRIAAVAPVAGVRDVPGCVPARAVPVVAFHGTADEYVAFTGGIGPRGLALPAPDGSGRTLGDLPDRGGMARGGRDPIPVIMAGWAHRNGCAAGSAEEPVAADVVEVVYRCAPTAATVLYRVEGGGHTWPGSPVSVGLASVLGRTTTSIDANAVMWQFFTDHPLRAASG